MNTHTRPVALAHVHLWADIHTVLTTASPRELAAATDTLLPFTPLVVAVATSAGVSGRAATRKLTRAFMVLARNHWAQWRDEAGTAGVSLRLLDAICDVWVQALVNSVVGIVLTRCRALVDAPRVEIDRAVDRIVATLVGRVVQAPVTGFVAALGEPYPPVGWLTYAPAMWVRRCLAAVHMVRELSAYRVAMAKLLEQTSPYEHGLLLDEVLAATQDEVTRLTLTDSPTVASSVNLGLLAGGKSYLAWVRAISPQIARSKLRDARGRYRREMPLETVPLVEESSHPVAIRFAAADAGATRLSMLRPSQQVEATLVRGATVAAALRVPLPLPPVQLGLMKPIRETLVAFPNRAVGALRAHLDEISGVGVGERSGVDAALMELWRDFRDEEAVTVLEHDAKFAVALAQAAVAPVPGAGGEVRAVLRVVFRAAHHHPAWPGAKVLSKYLGLVGRESLTDEDVAEVVAVTRRFSGLPQTASGVFGWLRRLHVVALERVLDERSRVQVAGLHSVGAGAVPVPES